MKDDCMNFLEKEIIKENSESIIQNMKFYLQQDDLSGEFFSVFNFFSSISENGHHSQFCMHLFFCLSAIFKDERFNH
jgi:hypothetical protein